MSAYMVDRSHIRFLVTAARLYAGRDLFNLASVNVPMGKGWNDPTTRANARLIACAPDLLSALQTWEYLAGGMGVPFDAPLRVQTRAAIAKAEGH